MTNTLVLRTVSQAVLFTHELCGQLSDGHWENASPREHWVRPFADPEVYGTIKHVRLLDRQQEERK
jgi:hypothetical protein